MISIKRLIGSGFFVSDGVMAAFWLAAINVPDCAQFFFQFKKSIGYPVLSLNSLEMNMTLLRLY
jgi:hypothetical protein